jgi:hypothetical protein
MFERFKWRKKDSKQIPDLPATRRRIVDAALARTAGEDSMPHPTDDQTRVVFLLEPRTRELFRVMTKKDGRETHVKIDSLNEETGERHGLQARVEEGRPEGTLLVSGEKVGRLFTHHIDDYEGPGALVPDLPYIEKTVQQLGELEVAPPHRRFFKKTSGNKRSYFG